MKCYKYCLLTCPGDILCQLKLLLFQTTKLILVFVSYLFSFKLSKNTIFDIYIDVILCLKQKKTIDRKKIDTDMTDKKNKLYDR